MDAPQQGGSSQLALSELYLPTGHPLLAAWHCLGTAYVGRNPPPMQWYQSRASHASQTLRAGGNWLKEVAPRHREGSPCPEGSPHPEPCLWETVL